MSRKIFTLYPHLLLLPMMLLSIIGMQQVQAQDCIVACNSNLNFPLPETNGDCTVQIHPEMLANTGSGACAADELTITLLFQNNTPIPNSPFVDETYIGQTLKYHITHLPTQGSCWGNLTVYDNKPPSIDNCDDQTIHCFQDARPDYEGGDVPTPTFTDCSSLEYDYEDDVTTSDCADGTTDIITRTWTVTDAYDNVNTCTQQIEVERISLRAGATYTPQCPADLDFVCAIDSSPSIEPEVTGYPYFVIDGSRFDVIPGEQYFCTLASTYRDDVYPLCGGGVKIQRTWLITDWCSPNVLGVNPFSCIQTIKIEDKNGPVIDCIESLTVNANSTTCEAAFPLPIAVINDDCSDIEEVIIRTAFGNYTGNNGQLATLPVGEHLITYEATDACNNTSTCTSTIIVKDKTPPIAVCNESTAVGLTIDGGAIVYAESFDRGSFDNCAVDTFLVRRMASSCIAASEFDSFVAFDCCEVGEVVMVQFRVFDTAGNFNDCMVEVEVQDKLPPVVTCPPDKTVDCSTDLDDLSSFGQVGVLDNCSYEVEEDVVYMIDNCGTGTVRRTFTVTDQGGQASTCTQTIYVENDEPFTEDLISWPANYTSSICDQDISPDGLPVVPENYGFPIFRGATCDNVMATFNDEILEGDFPACYKILRHWTVIDWCQYNPNVNRSGGRWEYEQFIKIEDTQLPVLDCPAEVFADNDTPNCTDIFVTIPPINATDCSQRLFYSYRVDYHNNGQDLRYFVGPDASGNFPLGRHRIIYQVADGCENLSTCESFVTVRDTKPPTAICNNGISVDLMEMSGGTGIIELDPTLFDASSSDNCTSRENLQITISPSRLTCDDIGTNNVTLTITDEAGNTSRCETFVVIQDNDNGCTGRLSAALGGHVQSEDGNMVEEVKININGTENSSQMTSGTGEFMFTDLPLNGDYTLLPQKTDDLTNGVTTFDLVLMTKHILGIRTLDSPYKMLAADINHSNSITTLDLVLLRKVILNLEQEFPGNESWRFIDASYEFPDPTNPFIDDIPALRSYSDVERSDMAADFIAIKIGDVNGSAVFSNLQSTDERSETAEWSLWAEDQQIQANEEFTVMLTTNEWAQMVGYQFTIQFDNNLEFIDFKNSETLHLSENNFNLNQLSEGIITTSWHDLQATKDIDVKEQVELFALTFRAKKSLQLSEVLSINSSTIEAQAYREKDEQIELLPIILRFRTADITEGIVLYQNRPNPFVEETQISFYLPYAEEVTLSVFDMAGKLLYETSSYYATGLNSIELESAVLRSSGVLYYRLEADGFTATRKMIRL